jgi:excinuclease ABC subunit A
MDSQVIDKKIIIEGAEMHNLKNIHLSIPKKKLVVVTGLSGSGKSSLAFDTIYAEGQRRFIESLSSYTRQFLGKLIKPKIKKISGLSPAIAIEQRVNNSNPRSTVGTSSEVYEYIKLLYARIGKTISPLTGQEIKRDNIDTVINYIKSFSEGDKFLMLVKLDKPENITTTEFLSIYSSQGFSRVEADGNTLLIEDVKDTLYENLYLVIDRGVYKDDDEYIKRIIDSIENGFNQGSDSLYIKTLNDNKLKFFTKSFEENGERYIEPNEHLFSFNNPFGACGKCDGYGDIIGIDPELVIPNTELSIYEDCIAPWRGEN